MNKDNVSLWIRIETPVLLHRMFMLWYGCLGLKEIKENERLYVIGNGFDIHHWIDSKYVDFKKWVHGTEGQVPVSDRI